MTGLPIKRGTALRLGLEPPRGPMLGVITVPGGVMTPEEYRQFKDRFAKAVKGNWQFVYDEQVAKWRSVRRWWPGKPEVRP